MRNVKSTTCVHPIIRIHSTIRFENVLFSVLFCATPQELCQKNHSPQARKPGRKKIQLRFYAATDIKNVLMPNVGCSNREVSGEKSEQHHHSRWLGETFHCSYPILLVRVLASEGYAFFTNEYRCDSKMYDTSSKPYFIPNTTCTFGIFVNRR